MQPDQPPKNIPLSDSAVDPSGPRRDQSATPTVSLPPQIDIFNLKGFRCRYSVSDAAASLWQRENTLVRRNDAPSVARLQARLRSGNFRMTPTQEELQDFLIRLRRDGLDGQMDWLGLAAELKSFQDTPAEELDESLNYMASRYVSVLDKLNRNYKGPALAEQASQLERLWVAGTAGLTGGYLQLLRNSLGVSDADAQAVQSSLDVLMAQRIYAYRGATAQANAAAQTGPDRLWLQNHDAYMAARLREAVPFPELDFIPDGGTYSVHDLTTAGQLAQSYQSEIESAGTGGRNEAQLALNLAFTDMKAETLIQQGLVSGQMAALLRRSRSQGHSAALAAAGRYLLAAAQPSRAMSPPAVIERTVFQDIYEAVLDAYHQNGGNGAEAIRAGVALGKMATARAYAKNPAARWGKSMEQYWETFYTTPPLQKQTQADQQIEQLLAKIGCSPRRSNSTYQNYINDWQSVLAVIAKG